MKTTSPSTSVDPDHAGQLSPAPSRVLSSLAPDARTLPFASALRRGVIELQRCQECQECQAPPLPFCRSCGGASLSTVEATGTATVVSMTRVHHRFHEVAPEPPYTVILVELDEGPRLFGLAAARDGLELGASVRIQGPFETFGPWFEAPDEGA